MIAKVLWWVVFCSVGGSLTLAIQSRSISPYQIPKVRSLQTERVLTNATSGSPSEPLVVKPLAPMEEEIIGEEPNRASFVEWLLGAVGINQQEKPDIVTPPGNCAPCSCGLTYKHNRIVGGVETLVNEYPWMTELKYNDRFYCGASVINNKYLLTAAHCVNGFNRNRLTAVFLDHDRSSSFETKTITRKISAIIRHQGYGLAGSYNNDIALLKLDQDLEMTGILKPVCLPPTGRSFTGNMGIVIGWGATQEHGAVANRLQEVNVPIMSNTDCKKTGYGNRITDNMLCAGYPKGMKDSCQGDSGGPLHVTNGTQHQIVGMELTTARFMSYGFDKLSVSGIVSWGEGCAQPNYPGVYTRVNRYIS